MDSASCRFSHVTLSLAILGDLILEDVCDKADSEEDRRILATGEPSTSLCSLWYHHVPWSPALSSQWTATKGPRRDMDVWMPTVRRIIFDSRFEEF